MVQQLLNDRVICRSVKTTATVRGTRPVFLMTHPFGVGSVTAAGLAPKEHEPASFTMLTTCGRFEKRAIRTTHERGVGGEKVDH